MEIKAKLVKAFDSGKLKALFDVTLDGKFAIHGVKLISGEKGDFVAMPSNSWKNKQGQLQHDDIVHPLDSDTRAAVFQAVQDAYLDHTAPMTQGSGPGELPFGM